MVGLAKDLEEAQRKLASCALEALPGFALAGSGAIREHGLIERPTQDIDLFSTLDHIESPEDFSDASDALIETLSRNGYVVQEYRSSSYFRSLLVSKDGLSMQLDLALDHRAHEPSQLSIGPVLSLEDAVASKLGALFSRGEARDYLDVDRIRSTSGLTDEELLDLIADIDGGFTPELFAEALKDVRSLDSDEVESYGYTPSDLQAVQDRLGAWADGLMAHAPERDSPLSLREAGRRAQRAALSSNELSASAHHREGHDR